MPTVRELMSQNISNAVQIDRSFNKLFYFASAYDIFPGSDVTEKLQKLVDLANSEGRTTIVFPEAAEYFVTSIDNDENIVYFGDGASFTGGYGRVINSLKDYLSIDAQLADLAFNVKKYGAVGDGETDDTSAVQSAVNAAAIDGGTVLFPGGIYRVRNIGLFDNISLVGTPGSVTIKLPDGVDGQLLSTPGQNDGVTLKNVRIEGLIFDGNKDKSAKIVASSAVAINNCDGVTIRDCVFRDATGYGLAFQAYPGGPLNGNQKNLHVENCHFLNNGDGVGGDTHDGLDIKYCEDSIFINCQATSNVDKGINIRGVRVKVIGCSADGNGADGFLFQGNHTVNSLLTEINVSDCSAEDNGGSGFYVADGSSSATQNTKVNLNNIISKNNLLYGINIDPGSNKVFTKINNADVYGNIDHGIRIRVPAALAIITNSSIYGNGGSGIFTGSSKTQISDCQISANARYGVEETGTRTVISGATYVQGNTLGNFLFAANKRYVVGRGVIDYDIGTSTNGDIIVSAGTITLPEGGDVFFITGTTNISTITASRRGRVITLQFTSSVVVNHATGNIRLSGGTNVSALNRHTLTLMCDGTSWFQISYSANT